MVTEHLLSGHYLPEFLLLPPPERVVPTRYPEVLVPNTFYYAAVPGTGTWESWCSSRKVEPSSSNAEAIRSALVNTKYNQLYLKI